MITAAPLPQWASLIKLPFCKVPLDEELARLWSKEGDEVVWFSKTAWSLCVIARWWTRVFANPRPTVWVPSYFCNQSLWPLRQLGVNLIFYPIQEDFTPDWSACAKLAAALAPNIFILTHFYGFQSDVRASKEFCEKHNALMIEDAAHVLTPTHEIGELGHFILYSPHKFFPISQGAICIIRPETHKYVEKNGGQWYGIDMIRGEVGKDSYPFWWWLSRKIFQKLTFNFAAKFSKPAPFGVDGTNQEMPHYPCMNYWSKKMLFFELSRISRSVIRRFECAEAWRQLLMKSRMGVLNVSLSADTVPYVAVFAAPTESQVEEIYKILISRNVPVASWPDLPPEVRENPLIFFKAIHLRNTLLILPVHQALCAFEILRRYGTIELGMKSL